MKEFIAAGALNTVLDRIIDGAALSVFGAKHGIAASPRLIDSELAKIPAFQGPDGKFSQTAYRNLLQQRGLNEPAIRQEIADGLTARQILVPAAAGAKLPRELALRYAALLTERRAGTIAFLPSAAFAPPGEPPAAELATYYSAHRNSYIRPERRVIRYVVFDDTALKSVPAPTEAEIAQRYSTSKALYAPSESRRLTQLVLPTEAAAKAVQAELAAGKTLEAAAAAKGLATATLGPATRDGLVKQTNGDVAAAVFAAAQGKLAGPVKAPLGWALLRVDAVIRNPGKSLDQARSEITTALAAEKKRAAVSDFAAKIEEELGNGNSLGDVAKQLSLTVQESPPLVADGRVYADPVKTAPPVLARVVQTAFAMEREGQPQLAEVVPGKQFLVFDVARIDASAAAPIAEIRADVIADYKLDKGSAAARVAAGKVQAALKKGTDVAAALAALGVPLPPVQRLDLSRKDIADEKGQIPPPLGLMFAMAQGTSKALGGQRNSGWYLVSLEKIMPNPIAADDPQIGQWGKQLGDLASREYQAQLRTAIRAEVKIKKNQTAIDAVVRQLTGGN
jgi:peptidyl-prolyl cis-trans isomerase D